MQEVTKIPACLAAARTAPARSKVCRSCTMGFCAMFPAEKSAMSSAVVLLSSVISAIPHLTRSLTTPLGYVRSPSVAVTAIHTHADYPPHCTSQRLLRVWGHATGRPRAAYYTRTPERAPYRGGKRGVPWLHTLCGVRYAMPHRVSTPPEQGSPRYGGDRIASIRIDGMDPSSCTPTKVSIMMKVGSITPFIGGST